MKTKLMLLAAAVALSGCNSMDNIPNPSPEQEKAAQLAYEDLRDGKYDEFLDQLEPQLQTQFKDNEKLMKRFSRSIPQGEYKSKTLMTKEIEEATNQPGQYKVSYEISYPENLVQYDVSFDKPNGSNKIRNFNIQVFGESSK
ncbi:DUF3887 domain-containing protein [Acinetobacter lwoffii]|uniref:DUF3887 domain-containing protein n=1 Tax=Acinetobacter lwoffii TaxID=28090 RepID=UPI00209A9DE9|nr:DUF3887 domain-containing protein [Acinetobacter lwoffii]MCO8060558.1 DUF3887 domain-containing protein [Acinetobacter lwoffii]MCO8093529.1 DUF3887 domain-containing protein [Acinetobacter lwoffii]